MFKGLAAATALVALTALSPAAHAQRATLGYSGKVVTYKVRTTALYQITAYGAQGGDDVLSDNVVGEGGLGAEIGGNFTLAAGERIRIAVGGKGSDYTDSGGGGGGGSFVVGPDNAPLVIAGGGGGGGISRGPTPLPGGPGLTSLNGGFGGGTDGNGGQGGVGSFGGGGGGGGAAGGAGGGGGYSGGAGSSSDPGGDGNGGGGGSYDAGTDQILTAGAQAGDGEVVIRAIFVGTPGKPRCHGEVVSHLAKQYGGLDAAAGALGYSSADTMKSDIAQYCAG